MIDLKELETKIDQLLESETQESLTNWLTNKRRKSLNQLLGNGNFFNLPSMSSTFNGKFNCYISSEKNNEISGENHYPKAA
jgi:hypothetical protein